MSSSADSVSSHEGSHLWTLEEIGRLTSHSGNHADTLSNIVLLIQRRFGTEVCSVYLLEPDRANLVLAATIGLRPESVGRVRMHLSEGLAGLVAEQLRPQVLADATLHPRFKYFPETGEDLYRSFLGVPVIDRGLLQGVLVVQTVEPRVFNADDVRMFVTAGAQLAPLVSEARTVGQFVAPAHQRLRTLAQNLWWSWDHEATRANVQIRRATRLGVFKGAADRCVMSSAAGSDDAQPVTPKLLRTTRHLDEDVPGAGHGELASPAITAFALRDKR